MAPITGPTTPISIAALPTNHISRMPKTCSVSSSVFGFTEDRICPIRNSVSPTSTSTGSSSTLVTLEE